MARAPAPLSFYTALIADQQRQRENDPVRETLAAMQEDSARQTIVQSGSPDDAAKANRVAREVGEPPVMVEDRLGDVEKGLNANYMASVMSGFPVVGSFFAANPRTLVAAQDDHRAVGFLGSAWDTLTKVPAELKVSGATLVGMANDTFYSLGDIGSTISYPIDAALATAINSPIGKAVGLPAYDPDAERAKLQQFVSSMRNDLSKRTEAMRPQYTGPIQEGLLRGLDTSALTLAALATRNPRLAAGVIGAAQGGQSYQDARAAGKDFGTTVRYAATQGIVEAATELAPESALLGALAKRAGPAKVIASYLAEELPGEMTATFLQSLSDWQVMHPEKTYNDWVKSLPDDEAQTVLGVLGGGTFTAAAAKGAQVGAGLLDKALSARDARKTGDVLTRFEKAATESKLRARDPVAYAELVQHVATDAGVDHVLIPADAVREYMQSDGYDRFSDALEPYRDHVEEAFATGGDVVLPADFALGTLPGTSAWSALKDDMRLTSGGMSAREAQTFEEAMADVQAELESEMQADHADTQAALDAQGKLIKSVQDKLMNAGFTPYAAQQYSSLIVQRVNTRAARNGQEVNGGEFTTDVRQVLPPELAKVRDADATDLVINALRKSGDPTRQSGDSLLEWISKRGGVNDTGGDLASMGLGDWHKGKPGKRKLLRKFDPNAGVASGQGDYGIDSTLRAAIDAGYFPELANVANEQGVNTLDTQVLYDAMSAELAGSKRFASDARTDGYRAAAAELDQLLAERGIDPAGLTDAELRDVVARLDREGPDGGWLNDGPRGRIRFEQVPVIELFQGRNMSTLLHELGHQYLEEMRFDAEGMLASDQLTQDWRTVQDWFAKNGHAVTDGVIPVEAHELWARGFERYLMEGKAPSSALSRVFETFRGWLLAIYKRVDALRSPITPEIREVFDRLLATDEEIQQAREAQALMPLFKDAAAIGMTGPEFDAYRAQFDAARADAQGEVLAKTMRAIRQRVTKEYRDQRAVVEADIAEQVDARPVFKALRNLKSEPVSAEWLRENMGQDVFDLLPKRVPPIWKDGGAHPDAIAEMSGYGTGRQMIEALIGAERAQRQAVEGGDKRSMRERTIQTETDAEMNARVGDPLNDGTIEREALAAVNSEKQGEVLASELRALSRKTGQRPTPYRIARQWARQRVRRGAYNVEASPSAIQRHSRAVAKAGTEAEKAMLAGKFDEVFAAKQRQMLSSALLAEAKQAHDDVTAAQQRMDKIARRQTSKSVDQDYLDQAHALLEQVDLRPRSQKSIERQGKWAEWAAQREAEGFDVVVPQSFEATLGKDHWTRLPVETLIALDETVQQIMHLGRLKQSLIDGKERREWEAIWKEASDSAGNLRGKPPRDLMEPGWADAVKSGVAQIDASLLKMETIIDWLDGGDPNGVFNRIAFRPVADAQAREQDMLKDYYGQIKALFEAVPANVAKRWQDKLTLPFTNRETGLPERMKRHQLIAAALNVGNAGNLQRLTDGHGWNAAALQDYLAQELTADEWQFVQGVWDTIEKLWPEIEALERRVNGVAPEKVEATEIVTPHGTFRGGYYPAIYDTSRSYRQEEHRAAGDNSLFEPNAIRATTRSGSTKARAQQVNAPILLDLGVINRHLGEVIHDITHREAVMQAWKFLTNERVMRVVDQVLGVEIRQQFKPWVKFVANSWAMERAGNEGFGKWIGKLRANATAVGMGLRATTMVTQIAGYSNSAEVVGAGRMAEAIVRFSASPISSWDFVRENSDEVRHRMDTLDRDIRTELARMAASNPASKAAREVAEAKRFFFHGIGYMDRLVVVPTWMAAYNKATAEGMDHDAARYAADKVVRQTQGAGAPKDLAAIQRGTGTWGKALQLMTMFYSYFSAQYQRQRTMYRDATGEDVRRPRNMPALTARAFFLLVLPPLLTEVLRAAVGASAGPDDDEWWTQWVMRKLLSNAIGPIPMARDVFEPAWNAARGAAVYNPQFSPINRVLSSYVNVAGDAGKIARGDETKQATKHALEAVGYTTGLVPGQIASATQFLVDVGEGDANPRDLSDWLEGLSTGKIKDK